MSDTHNDIQSSIHGIPDLKTGVSDLLSTQDVDALIEDFTQQFSKQDLYEVAENYMSKKFAGSSIDAFRKQDREHHRGDGLMALVISLIVLRSCGVNFVLLELAVRRLMQHYGFTAESAPPRLLLREALAHMARVSSLLADISREQGFSNMPKFIEFASKLSPEEVYRLSNEEVDSVLREIT